MRNVVQLCLAANNILLKRKRNHAFLFLTITLEWKKGRSVRFPKIFIKKQTWWSNDKKSIIKSETNRKNDDLGCKYKSFSFDISTRAGYIISSLFRFERVEQSRSFKLRIKSITRVGLMQ